MATIVLRSVKGSALTHTEMDDNFNNLNTDKLENAGDIITGPLVFNTGVNTNASVTEDGLDRSSAGAETFNIQNSGAGAMTLQVDGNAVLTTADEGSGNGIDADTVDGNEATIFNFRANNLSDVANAATARSNLGIGSGVVELGTAQATTSGSSVDFTGIDSSTIRITISFENVSTDLNGADLMLRLGDSGGLETTGYISSIGVQDDGVASEVTQYTDHIRVWDNQTSVTAESGVIILTKISGNKWICTFTCFSDTADEVQTGGGYKELSGTLDRIRFFVDSASYIFDNGSINIITEHS